MKSEQEELALEKQKIEHEKEILQIKKLANDKKEAKK
jgi:hypothetical protein